MADIIDINVFQSVNSISFEVEPITNIVNINKITVSGGEVGIQDLQAVTDVGSYTSKSITANSFIKIGGTGNNLLLDNGTTIPTTSIVSTTNLSPTQTAINFTINSDTGTDATIPLGNGTSAGATINDYTTTEKNKLAGIATGAEVNVNADWNATSGDAMILNKPSTLGLQNYIASGTDTYTATIAGVTSYVDGAGYLIRFTNGNTQTCSININGLGARALYRNNDGQLIGGDIQDLGEMLLVYSSALSAFKCIGTSPNDIIAYVTNAESITITKGQPVYAFGATGDRMTVKLAYNTLDSTSAQTVGLVMSTSIAAGQKGYIITQGLLDNLSTLSSPFIDGDTVYLGATAGTITRVKPSAPNHLVYLGVVTTASAGTAGRMYVKPQNGYELSEIHDVALTSPPTNNDGLFYETSTDLWKNKSIATALGYTPYNATNPSGYQTASQVQTIADAKVANTITNGVTTSAPNQDVVFDALALKAPLTSPTFSGTVRIPGTGENVILSIGVSGDFTPLPLSGYPGLMELSFVKGVTSNIQTQLNGKQTETIIVTSGTSFTTPSNITTSTVFIIQLVGAGGGGSGGLASNGHGSGAGGGGYVYKRITGLSPSTTYTCAIGTGGTGGAALGNGTAGTSTTLTIGVTTYTASGGGFGTATLGSAGGTGGTGSNGDINISGQNGDYTALTTAATVHSSRGGVSPKGWGLGGAGVAQAINGQSGTGFGGGGSAGKAGASTGGNGSNGIIYCQYFN